jgi:hypothetical protein
MVVGRKEQSRIRFLARSRDASVGGEFVGSFLVVARMVDENGRQL